MDYIVERLSITNLPGITPEFAKDLNGLTERWWYTLMYHIDHKSQQFPCCTESHRKLNIHARRHHNILYDKFGSSLYHDDFRSLIRYVRNADQHGLFRLKEMEECVFLSEVLSIFPYFERLVKTVALTISGKPLESKFAVQNDFLSFHIWTIDKWKQWKSETDWTEWWGESGAVSKHIDYENYMKGEKELYERIYEDREKKKRKNI
jgi:hypothetical protein